MMTLFNFIIIYTIHFGPLELCDYECKKLQMYLYSSPDVDLIFLKEINK